MQNDFDNLLEKLGIARTFTDAAQNHKEYRADDETLRKMVNYLGFELKNINDSGALLQKLENRRWQSVLEAVYVVKSSDIRFDAVVKTSQVSDIVVSISTKDGAAEFEYEQYIVDKKTIGGNEYAKIEFKINSELKPQYYDLKIKADSKDYHSVLAVSPDSCYIPLIVEEQKVWGFAIQLYALRSKCNWGVGDFSDLAEFAKMCKKVGADVIGVNPLNVLNHDNPENASPYSSISRLFLNPIYIDVEKVKGFDKSEVDYTEIDEIKQKENIDYTSIYNIKIKALKKLYKQFIKNNKSEEFADYEKFCRLKGVELNDLAVYQTICTVYKDKYHNWKDWPEELQNPQSLAVAKFQKDHSEEIGFFKFLQYWAEKQLNEAQTEIKKAGLKIGLYRDLPVGLNKNSAELWSGHDLFIDKCGAGAPPDVFFPTGQKWCLGAFNPFALKDMAYLPFIKILRSAMQGAGALRIDHVMSLMRLYIIPDNSDNGTYVYYNFDDMLGIVALESYLNKCMVVGESIGNVPDGFIEKIHGRGIYSLSVLWAERWDGCGDFKLPRDFPRTAFCSVGTHDMPPLKMRWFGYDIETMYNLKMLSDDERINQYKGREDERRRLLGALDYAGVWPCDKPRQGDCLYGEGYPNGILEAVEKYAASGNCAVYLAQLEDIFGVDVLQNLPGTDEATHPNWRRKLPVNLEDYEQSEDFNRVVDIIKLSR
ncbi:MAG: 4-alpha-glucanotransferase [Alphaproteobacteria bacterium]|nr:4-alpha-glucanotransferase [Alphaproteobacteria bacterium]